jgi:NitT/TauT family transport system substrate-binding protein
VNPRPVERAVCGALLIGCITACSAQAPTLPSSSATTPAAPAAAAQRSTSRYTPTPLSPPATIRVGDARFNPEAPVYIALERGYFRDEGLNVELVPTAGPSLAAQMLATGQLQFLMLGPDPALLNALASGIDIKIIASAVTNRESDRTGQVIVRTDLIESGAYMRPQDLKDASIGVTGDMSQFYVERFLNRSGMTGADVHFVQLSLADILPALESRAIAAAWEVEPLATIAANKALAKPVATIGQIYPGVVSNALLMAPGLERTQPPVTEHFVMAYLRGLRDYYHAFNKGDSDRAPLVDILASHTSAADPRLFDVIGMHTVDPNGAMNPTSWNDFQDYYVGRGDQVRKLDLNQYVDSSLLDAALDRLGRE